MKESEKLVVSVITDLQQRLAKLRADLEDSGDPSLEQSLHLLGMLIESPSREEVTSLLLKILADDTRWPRQSYEIEGRLRSPADLEKTINYCPLTSGMKAILKVFVNEKGEFVVLSRKMAVVKVMGNNPSFKASTFTSDFFTSTIKTVSNALYAPLTFVEDNRAYGDNERSVKVYYLAYRNK